MTRFDRTVRTVTVRHIANPLGRNNGENPPHLGDLRAFVAECEGLPDDLWVRIDNGNINESGRRDTTFEVSWAVPLTQAERAEFRRIAQEETP